MTSIEKDNLIAYLQKQNADLLKQVDGLNQQIEALNHQVYVLTEMILQMRRGKFGPSSEKTPIDETCEQLYFPQVFNEVEIEADDSVSDPCKITKESKIRARSKGTRKELILKDIPIVEMVYAFKDSSTICPDCGSALKMIGQKFIRDELDYIPAQIRIIRHIQTSYECPKCKHSGNPYIVAPEVPKSLLSHSLASASSVANVMYQKYVNAIPLYRQEKEWEDLGIDLSRATMSNWIIRSCEDYLDAIAKHMQSKLIKRDIVHCDETPVQVLKEPGKKPQSKSYMWVYCTGNDGMEPIIIYDYNPSRSGDCAARFLKDFTGYIHTDGFSGYNKLKSVTRCGCWAHLRRKFVEAIPDKKSGTAKTNAEIGRDYCDKLFAIEKALKDMTPEERYLKRLELETPVLDEFWHWVEVLIVLPGSAISKAREYALNQKQFLMNYLLDGRLNISNNPAENAIRPFTVGRKNWLFSDTPKGAKASASIYSIIETAKANGVNVYSYLKYLLEQLPNSNWRIHPELLESFMPWSEQIKKECK